MGGNDLLLICQCLGNCAVCMGLFFMVAEAQGLTFFTLFELGIQAAFDPGADGLMWPLTICIFSVAHEFSARAQTPAYLCRACLCCAGIYFSFHPRAFCSLQLQA